MENNHKICTRCNELKSLDGFYNDIKGKFGKQSKCIKCTKELSLKRYRTEKGLLSHIYDTQTAKSKRRKHKPPCYTRIEFQKWALSKDEFHRIFKNWEDNNYETNLVPSFDRLDDNKGYSFDNIRIVTWYENNTKEYAKRKNGTTISKTLKPILQFDLNGNFIKEFYSIGSAKRELNVKNHSGIIRCCKNTQKFAHGFLWKYKEI